MTQRHGGVPSDSFVRLLRLVNGAQCRQLVGESYAGGYSDAGKDARVHCVANGEPTSEHLSLLACGKLS